MFMLRRVHELLIVVAMVAAVAPARAQQVQRIAAIVTCWRRVFQGRRGFDCRACPLPPRGCAVAIIWHRIQWYSANDCYRRRSWPCVCWWRSSSWSAGAVDILGANCGFVQFRVVAVYRCQCHSPCPRACAGTPEYVHGDAESCATPSWQRCFQHDCVSGQQRSTCGCNWCAAGGIRV